MQVENWCRHEQDWLEEEINASSIHIRIQQRSGRKSLTLVQGLSMFMGTEHIKNLSRTFKTEFACGVTLVNDEQYGPILQLQGDHRSGVRDYLVRHNIKKERIVIHGL
jgi:translation initiation factor 1